MKIKIFIFMIITFLIIMAIPLQSISIDDENNLFDNNIKHLGWIPGEVESISEQSFSGAFHPEVDVDLYGGVHVVWSDLEDMLGSGTDMDIFYRYKPSGGNWGQIELVSVQSDSISTRPTIEVDAVSHYVHVAWSDETDYDNNGNDLDIFYNYKFINQFSWTNPIEVVSTESDDFSSYCSMIIDNDGKVHIAWSDRSDYQDCGGADADIFYKYREGSGPHLDWSITEVVSHNSYGGSYTPDIAYSGGSNICIVWSDDSHHPIFGSDLDIVSSYKNIDINSYWMDIRYISTESYGNSRNPSAVMDERNLHVAWSDESDLYGAGTDFDIFYKMGSYDSVWSSIQTEIVSFELNGWSRDPYLDTNGNGNIHLVWSDQSKYMGSDDDIDIFYSKKLFGQPNWEKIQLVNIESTGVCAEPSIGVETSSERLHLIFMDDSDLVVVDNDYDVFYKMMGGNTELEIINPRYEIYSWGNSIMDIESFIPIRSLPFSFIGFTGSGLTIKVDVTQLGDETVITKVKISIYDANDPSYTEIDSLVLNRKPYEWQNWRENGWFHRYLIVAVGYDSFDVPLAGDIVEVYQFFNF